jgi:hypothetical protein
MAVNEDEQSLHNNSAHSTGSKSRKQEEQEIIEDEKKDEAVLYGLLGLNIDGGSGLSGVDMQNETSLSAVDEKTWDSMDSVHSRASTVTSQYFSAGTGNSEDSFNYDGSGDSFASFGDSFNELSSAAVEEIKDAFTDLDEKPKPPPPRRAPMMKQNSLRFVRGASFRGSLNCVEEKSEEFELPHSALIEE